MKTPSVIVALSALMLVSLLASEAVPSTGGEVTARDGSHQEDGVVLLTDFTDAGHNARWSVVNDNVMGGRSDGYLAFTDDERGVMTMTGDINTNGGGFTSVRMRVDPAVFGSEAEASVLDGLRAVRLRVRGDAESLGKPFALRLEDDVPRPRRINFRAVMSLDTNADPAEWQTVTVPVADLQPTHHGRRLNPDDWAPLDTSRLDRVGIILSGVDDGPYRFEVERIELLR